MLIAMTGQKRSGKDTVAEAISNYTLVFDRVSFAGPLKGMIKYLLQCAGFDDAKIEACMNGDDKETPLEVLQGKSARFAMQTLGTEWRDLIGKNLWTDIIRSKVAVTPNAILTDMRFLHEEAFVDALGGTKIRVVRAGQAEISADAHASEQEMGKIVPDLTIYNHGSLEDLIEAAEIAFDHISNSVKMRDAETNWNWRQA